MTARNTPGAVPAGATREDERDADAAQRHALDEGADRVEGLGLAGDGTSILDQVGNTPLVALSRLVDPSVLAAGVRVLAKLEGNNPAGSVKDRPALAMIMAAEARGEIRPGDTLIEATSGNTGIALAMVAAVKGYRMVLIMPETQSLERRQSMQAYGAELVLVSKEEGMEGARDRALAMQAEGRGRVLDQFSNDDNWRAHYRSTLRRHITVATILGHTPCSQFITHTRTDDVSMLPLCSIAHLAHIIGCITAVAWRGRRAWHDDRAVVINTRIDQDALEEHLVEQLL